MPDGPQNSIESCPDDQQGDQDLRLPATPEEYIDAYAEIWRRFADASAELAASTAGIWWNALPVARPEGLNMVGLAGLMASRLAKLGPEGDPLESAMLALIAYAQGARGQAMAEAEQIEELRAELREHADRNGS